MLVLHKDLLLHDVVDKVPVEVVVIFAPALVTVELGLLILHKDLLLHEVVDKVPEEQGFLRPAGGSTAGAKRFSIQSTTVWPRPEITANGTISVAAVFTMLLD